MTSPSCLLWSDITQLKCWENSNSAFWESISGGGGGVRCLCVFFIQVLIHEDSTVPGFQAAVEKKKKSAGEFQSSASCLYYIWERGKRAR